MTGTMEEALHSLSALNEFCRTVPQASDMLVFSPEHLFRLVDDFLFGLTVAPRLSQAHELSMQIYFFLLALNGQDAWLTWKVIKQQCMDMLKAGLSFNHNIVEVVLHCNALDEFYAELEGMPEAIIEDYNGDAVLPIVEETVETGASLNEIKASSCEGLECIEDSEFEQELSVQLLLKEDFADQLAMLDNMLDDLISNPPDTGMSSAELKTHLSSSMHEQKEKFDPVMLELFSDSKKGFDPMHEMTLKVLDHIQSRAKDNAEALADKPESLLALITVIGDREAPVEVKRTCLKILLAMFCYLRTGENRREPSDQAVKTMQMVSECRNIVIQSEKRRMNLDLMYPLGMDGDFSWNQFFADLSYLAYTCDQALLIVIERFLRLFFALQR